MTHQSLTYAGCPLQLVALVKNAGCPLQLVALVKNAGCPLQLVALVKNAGGPLQLVAIVKNGVLLLVPTAKILELGFPKGTNPLKKENL